MTDHTPVQEDPQELKRAQEFWISFTGKAKWAIIATAGLLIFLALAFVPFSS